MIVDINQPLRLVARHPEHGLVLVAHGELGYWKLDDTTNNRVLLDSMLTLQGPEVTEAALAGSMFGWDCPGAKAARDYLGPRLEAQTGIRLMRFLAAEIKKGNTVEVHRSVNEVCIHNSVEDWYGATLHDAVRSLPQPEENSDG